MKNKRILLMLSVMYCLLAPISSAALASTDKAQTDSERQQANYELEANIDYAVQKGNIQEIERLLSQGASPNTNALGYPILWRAADENYVNIVKLLIGKGADVNLPTRSGTTPLMAAAKNRNVDIVKMLLKANANINAKEKRVLKETALLYALSYISAKHTGKEKQKDNELINLLLDHGADVNAETAEQYTVLMRALMRADFNMIKQIVDKGADVNRVTMQGNALRFTLGDDKKTIQYILNKTNNIDAPTLEGNTPFMIASKIGATESIKLLADAGANIHAMNKKGQTALHLAAKAYQYKGQYNRVPAIKLLIELGIDPNIRAEKDTHFTALIRAAQEGYTDRAKALLEGGAEVDLHSGLGDTALMWAAQNGHVETVKLLLAHGADPNRPGFGGVTPLEHAKEHEAVRQLLIDAGASQGVMGTVKHFLGIFFN